MQAPWRPLHGLRVLELAPYLPGPHTGQLLVDLGAQVIKIEPPGGDPARALQEGLYSANNRGKRSVCLDLKAAGAGEIMGRLARWAEVVIEGHKPGVAARLGVDHAALAAHNPHLVYAALTGYGQEGADAALPGHDLNYLAAGGALARGGHWHGPPRRSGVPLADLAGALHAALAVLAGVQEVRAGGRGRFLDVSLTAAALRLASARGVDAPERAHLHPTNDLFQTADGALLAVALIEDHFYARFAEALSEKWPALAEPRFRVVAERRAHGYELHALLGSVIASRPLGDWLELAARHALPLSVVRDPRAAQDALSPGLAHTPFPARTDAPPWVPGPAPALGADTAQVLGELGYSGAEIEALFTRGVAS